MSRPDYYKQIQTDWGGHVSMHVDKSGALILGAHRTQPAFELAKLDREQAEKLRDLLNVYLQTEQADHGIEPDERSAAQ